MNSYTLVRKQVKNDNQKPPGDPVITCHYCKKKGHMAKECRKAAADRARESGGRETQPKPGKTKIRCYNCHELGHIAAANLQCTRK